MIPWHSEALEICARHGVSLTDVCGPRRTKRLVDARQDVAWMLHERGNSSTVIGKLLGGRDHATILALFRRRYIQNLNNVRGAASN